MSANPGTLATEDTARLATLGMIVRRRWRLLVALAVLGAIVGALASLLFSPGYQTSTSVLLQGPREPDELLTETQIAMSTVVLERASTELGWDLTGTELQDSVTAEVADGNVIAITATADTAERAQQLADQVAQEYVRFATQLISNTEDASAQALQEQRDALRDQIALSNDKITELHAAETGALTVESVRARTDLESMRITLAQAIAKLDELDAASSQANLVVMGAAEQPSSPAAPTMTHLILGGAVVFFVVGLFGHLFAARADRRLRDEAQIGAALGGTVLGGLDVPEPAKPAGSGRPAELRQWPAWAWDQVLVDRHWNDPELLVDDDEASRELRCRRLLSKLRGTSARAPRLLMVIPDDDLVAQRAGVQLVSTAAATGLARLDPVIVSATKPTIADRTGHTGLLVVVAAGSRAALELVALAGACADAGFDRREVTVVVAYRIRPAAQVELPRQPGNAMAGSP